MDESLPPDELLGKEVVIEWFGGEWPSFHDAEIVSLALSRKGTSLLRIYPYFLTRSRQQLSSAWNTLRTSNSLTSARRMSSSIFFLQE